MLELHAQVIEDADRAIEDANDWGAVDFYGVCMHVLSLEDSPEKAKALARLGGFALHYADALRQEEDSAESSP
jgi:hypothetical protein